MAPPPSQVGRLMENLFHWLSTTEAHPLIASTAFHYEFEFIHPFSDGNGRMGRLWQTLILSSWQPLLAYLPVETVIKNRQQDYYRLLGEADKRADCSAFIEFLLQSIQESLHQAIALQNNTISAKTPVETPVETPVKVRATTETLILELLLSHPEMSLSEVGATIGRSLRAVERAVAKLKAENRLIYEGSKKDGKWKVLP